MSDGSVYIIIGLIMIVISLISAVVLEINILIQKRKRRNLIKD